MSKPIYAVVDIGSRKGTTLEEAKRWLKIMNRVKFKGQRYAIVRLMPKRPKKRKGEK